MSEQCTTNKPVYCSFCGISNVEIPLGVIIDGGTATICDKCVADARNAVWAWRNEEWLKYKHLAP